MCPLSREKETFATHYDLEDRLPFSKYLTNDDRIILRESYNMLSYIYIYICMRRIKLHQCHFKTVTDLILITLV